MSDRGGTLGNLKVGDVRQRRDSRSFGGGLCWTVVGHLIWW